MTKKRTAADAAFEAGVISYDDPMDEGTIDGHPYREVYPDADADLREMARRVANTPDKDVEMIYRPPARFPVEIKKDNGHPVTPLTKAVRDVVNEYKRASKKFPPFNSAHEGIAIIEEEYDELWTEIKKKELHNDPTGLYIGIDTSKYRDKKLMREEAVQLAAMSLRFLIDVCSE